MILALQALMGLAMLVAFARPMGPVIPVPYAPVLAWALMLIGGVTAVAASAALGSSFQVHPRPRTNAQLVRHGIYRWLRHPMYTSVVLICLGLAIQSGALSTWTAAALNVVFYRFKARYEEALLRERYAGYAAYQETSWGVIPFTGKRRSSKSAGAR